MTASIFLGIWKRRRKQPTQNINGNNQGGYDESDKGDINFYENAGMDTWIGGDNDSSGYYWDYELDHNSEYYGEVILKDIVHDPITFRLRGSGTQSDPYLITNREAFELFLTKMDASFERRNEDERNDWDFTDLYRYERATGDTKPKYFHQAYFD